MHLKTNTHPSTNQARRRVTSFVGQTTLPLRKTVKLPREKRTEKKRGNRGEKGRRKKGRERMDETRGQGKRERKTGKWKGKGGTNKKH